MRIIVDPLKELIHITRGENKRGEESRAVAESGDGAKDYLSRLPDDCLLEIFKHLTRTDLCNLMALNKRVGASSNHQSLDKIKWQGGKLCLFQIERGYGFELETSSDHYQLGNITYRYETNEAYIGRDRVFVEKKTAKESPKSSKYGSPSLHFTHSPAGQMDERVWEMERRRTAFLTPSFRFGIERTQLYHNLAIPKNFFNSLKDILRYHGPNIVRIIQLPFDEILFSSLHSGISGQKLNTLACFNFLSNQVTNTTQKSFAKLMERIENVSLYMEKPDKLLPLVNEDFLYALGRSQLKQFTTNFDCDASAIKNNRFQPDVSILDRIVNIHSLEVPNMIMDVNWLTNFIMMYLDRAESEGRNEKHLGMWCVSVDQLITPELLTKHIRKPDYEYFPGHDIVNTNNGMYAHIATRAALKDPHLIYIFFHGSSANYYELFN